MRKKYNKFGAKKTRVQAKSVEWMGIKFESITERNEYMTLYAEQERGNIINLHKVTEPVVLAEIGHVLKNGKKSKQQDIKFKYDFSFYAINLKYRGVHLKDTNVNLEVKSKQTEKETAYKIRRRMFLKQMGKDEVFLEAISDWGNFTTVLWEKI